MIPPAGKLRDKLRYGIRLVRFRDFWDKYVHVAGCAGLLWVNSHGTGVGGRELVLYLAGVLCLLIGGYTLNDATDFFQDRLSGADDGKIVPCRSHSLFSAASGLATGMLLIAIAAGGGPPVFVTAGTILIGVEYSLPPLRFKDRGIWGVIVGALTQRPALFLIFAAMLDDWSSLSLILTVWLFAGGMAGMLGHQIIDQGRDRIGGARTFVIRKGSGSAIWLGTASAIVMGLAVLSPLVLMGIGKALSITAVLAGLSSVYLAKGFAAVRRIWPALFP